MCGRPSELDMEIHENIRKAVGPDMKLMSDPVAEYTLEEAVRVGRHLEKLGYEWLEEPFRDFELNKYTQLCAALDIPIAATETTRGCHWGRSSTRRRRILSGPMCHGNAGLREL